MALRRASERKSAVAQVAEKFATELEQGTDNIGPDDAIRRLRDVFIVKRLTSAVAVEDLRLKAVYLLLQRLEELDHKRVNPTMITAIIKTLSEVGASDLGVVTGTPTNCGVNLYNLINNKNTNPTAAMGSSSPGAIAGSDGATSSTVKDIGSLLEAIAGITDGVKQHPKLLDAQGTDGTRA